METALFEAHIKDLSELPDISTMEREEHGMPKNWGFSRGHNGLERNQWAVTHVHEDLSQDVYPLPMAVSVLVDWERSIERNDLQRSMRILLGMDY